MGLLLLEKKKIQHVDSLKIGCISLYRILAEISRKIIKRIIAVVMDDRGKPGIKTVTVQQGISFRVGVQLEMGQNLGRGIAMGDVEPIGISDLLWHTKAIGGILIRLYYRQRTLQITVLIEHY